ncbi:ComF family protein, partial [Candidatus Kaiserbacteria bacterium]|nr:ComF family protein [Candidatus Kaiserbacteria bacterium]
MSKLLTVIIDLLFPPSNHQLLIRQYKNNDKNLYFNQIFNNTQCLSKYSEPVIKAAITENKFNNHKNATRILSGLLEIWIEKQSSKIILIPIPLGPKRYRERGYNQVENILKEIKSPAIIRTDILSRPIDTEPQSQLDKFARQKNIKNAFKCSGAKLAELENVKIVLIDDVVTTGATMGVARA